MKDIILKGTLAYLPCHFDKRKRHKLHLHLDNIHNKDEGFWLPLNRNKMLGGEKFKSYFEKEVKIIITVPDE